MVNFEIKRGTGQKFEFVVYQDDKVTVDPLTNFTNILVRLIHQETGKLLEQYAMATLADYNTADFHIISAVGGTFNIAMQSALTLTADLGQYLVEVETWKTDSDFADGYEPTSSIQKLFSLIDSRERQ